MRGSRLGRESKSFVPSLPKGEGNVTDVQGFVIQPDFASAVKAQPGSTPDATA
jgi:hypothetical protein